MSFQKRENSMGRIPRKEGVKIVTPKNIKGKGPRRNREREKKGAEGEQ